VLEEAERDHGHERMAMQASPRPPFEVVEAEFLLHLLVGLLANPSRLDRGRQFLKACVGWKVERWYLRSPALRCSPIGQTSLPGR